jgi:hypothetical protein
MKTLWLAAVASLVLLCPASHAQIGSCGGNKVYASASLTASTQLVAAPASGSIRVCAVTIQIAQTSSAVTFGLTSGTGAACAAGNALVTPAFLGQASTYQSWGQVYGDTSAIRLPPQKALCLSLGGAPTGAVVMVIYTVY